MQLTLIISPAEYFILLECNVGGDDGSSAIIMGTVNISKKKLHYLFKAKIIYLIIINIMNEDTEDLDTFPETIKEKKRLDYLHQLIEQIPNLSVGSYLSKEAIVS